MIPHSSAKDATDGICEIALRGFAPRIENMRREVPSEYNAYILKLLKRVRDNRARAIEPFFSDTVLPAQKPTKQ